MLDSETTERITEGSKNLEQHMKIYDCVGSFKHFNYP